MFTTVDDAVVRGFLVALQQAWGAAEFERLMLGREETLNANMARLRDKVDAMIVRGIINRFDEREVSALDELRAERSLEQLQQRYPDVWERAMLSEGFAALEARGELEPGQEPSSEQVLWTVQKIEDAPGGPRARGPHAPAPTDADYIRAFQRWGNDWPLEDLWREYVDAC